MPIHRPANSSEEDDAAKQENALSSKETDKKWNMYNTI